MLTRSSIRENLCFLVILFSVILFLLVFIPVCADESLSAVLIIQHFIKIDKRGKQEIFRKLLQMKFPAAGPVAFSGLKRYIYPAHEINKRHCHENIGRNCPVGQSLHEMGS